MPPKFDKCDKCKKPISKAVNKAAKKHHQKPLVEEVVPKVYHKKISFSHAIEQSRFELARQHESNSVFLTV